MKITAIKQQVRAQNRFSVYIDDKFAFGLSERGLIDSHLAVGDEVSREEVGKLKQAADTDKLYDRALHYTALRPRSEWELRQYFKRKKAPTPLAEEILNKLRKNNLVDDEAFAKSWVESRRLLKPISHRRLVQELRAKRVSDDIIDKVLDADETNEQDVLRELVEKKRKQTKYRDDELKLMQYLARQGFNYDDIKSALNRID